MQILVNTESLWHKLWLKKTFAQGENSSVSTDTKKVEQIAWTTFQLKIQG